MKHQVFRSQRVPGHTLKWVEAGSGPSILFVHGCSGSWTNFHPQLADLSQHYRVVALDMRGHGASPWPGPSSVDDFYADLEEFVDAHLPPRFALVAHSFGGYLGARMAAERPKQVTALALLNTAGSIPSTPAYRLLQLLSPRANLISSNMPHLISTNSEVSQQMVYRTLKGWNCWDYYPKVEAPSLVVLGAVDPLIPVVSGIKVARLIPDCRLEIFPLGGHVVMWEQSQKLNRWLRELASGTPLVKTA